MAKLIYTAITSLDGYLADVDGSFDWAEPDSEVLAFVNDLERGIGTFLYGRRMYQTMAAWETMPTGPDQPAGNRDFAAIWRAADKVVFSKTLSEPHSARTRIERSFDARAVRQLLDGAERNVSVGGATLAAEALRARLVDEVRLFLSPVVVGGGLPVLPAGLRLDLDLADERRFGSGVVYLRYRARR